MTEFGTVAQKGEKHISRCQPRPTASDTEIKVCMVIALDVRKISHSRQRMLTRDLLVVACVAEYYRFSAFSPRCESVTLGRIAVTLYRLTTNSDHSRHADHVANGVDVFLENYHNLPARSHPKATWHKHSQIFRTPTYATRYDTKQPDFAWCLKLDESD